MFFHGGEQSLAQADFFILSGVAQKTIAQTNLSIIIFA
jgi:hypothetical protein